jgi:hypothetical protein
MFAHGGKVRPARDEMHVRATFRQPGAEIAADAAGAHDRDFQGRLP